MFPSVVKGGRSILGLVGFFVLFKSGTSDVFGRFLVLHLFPQYLDVFSSLFSLRVSGIIFGGFLLLLTFFFFVYQ